MCMNQVPELRLMARHKSHWPVNVVAALFVLITAAITNLTFPHNVSGSTGSARLQNSFHPVSLSTPLSSVKKIPKTPPIPLRIYDIHRGNTLWAIAVRFHVPVQELERVNHLTSPTIYAGQTLIIPRISVVRIEPRDTLNATVGPHPVSDMALRPENPPSSHRSHSGQSLALKEPPGTQGSCTSVNDELTPSPPLFEAGFSSFGSFSSCRSRNPALYWPSGRGSCGAEPSQSTGISEKHSTGH